MNTSLVFINTAHQHARFLFLLFYTPLFITIFISFFYFSFNLPLESLPKSCCFHWIVISKPYQKQRTERDTQFPKSTRTNFVYQKVKIHTKFKMKEKNRTKKKLNWRRGGFRLTKPQILMMKS